MLINLDIFIFKEFITPNEILKEKIPLLLSQQLIFYKINYFAVNNFYLNSVKERINILNKLFIIEKIFINFKLHNINRCDTHIIENKKKDIKETENIFKYNIKILFFTDNNKQYFHASPGLYLKIIDYFYNSIKHKIKETVIKYVNSRDRIVINL